MPKSFGINTVLHIGALKTWNNKNIVTNVAKLTSKNKDNKKTKLLMLTYSHID